MQSQNLNQDIQNDTNSQNIYKKYVLNILQKANQTNIQQKMSSLKYQVYEHKHEHGHGQNGKKKVHLITLDNISSTMILSSEWPRQSLIEGNTVNIFGFRALQQSDGKGQKQNKWHSPKGNVYITLLMRLKPQDFPYISMMVANCIKKVLDLHLIENKVNKQVKLKWINDIILDGQKIGGILVKNTLIGQSLYAEIGIGINTQNKPQNKLLDNLEACCLRNYIKKDIDFNRLSKQIINQIILEMDKDLDIGIKNEKTSKLYEKNLYLINQQVQIWNFNYENLLGNGTFLGVNLYGHAKLQGIFEPFIQGRMKRKFNMQITLPKTFNLNIQQRMTLL